MAATFAAPRFATFIPYTPPGSKTPGRPPLPDTSACSPRWLDVDGMIKALDEQGDEFLDTLAATPSFDAMDAGSQTGSTQNVLEDIEYDESNNMTSDSGAGSAIVASLVPILSPADDAPGLQAARGEEEDCRLERHDHRAESPHVMVGLLDGAVENAVVQLVRADECRDGTPLADDRGVLRAADEQQDMDTAQPATSKDAVELGKQTSEVADDTHLGSRNTRSPSQCSIAGLDSPSPSDDSMFEAWPSGTSFRDSSGDEIEPCQPKRARRQRKQRNPYSRKQVTPPISKGQGSWCVHKPMWSRRSPQGSSKRSDWAINTDGPQNPLGSCGTSGALVPQKLSQINLRQLESGEIFMAAVIQDERKVAAFAYDQSVKLIKRSIGCDREVNGLSIMPISLNSWLLTGFFRMDEHQDPRLCAQSSCLMNDEIDASLAGKACNPCAEHTEPDCWTDYLHEVVSQDNRGSIEDDLQPIDGDERPEVTTGHRKPPWTLNEEKILTDLADHKSWEEIGELLGRPPGGVSQHWRKMQLAADGELKSRSKRKQKKAR